MFDVRDGGSVLEEGWEPSAADVAEYWASLSVAEFEQVPDVGDSVDAAPFDLAPGAHAALVAEVTDVSVLDPAGALGMAGSLGRLESWVQARQLAALAAFAERCPVTGPKDRGFGARADISEFVVDEISCALGWTRRSAQVRLELALQLVDTLPETLAALASGRLDLVKVRIIAERVAVLSPALAAAVQDRVLPKVDGLTSGQLRRVVDRAIIAVDPAGANARHERARHERHVEVRPGVEGMSTLRAELSAEDAALTYATLSLIARAIPSADPRTMNQRRADALVDLIAGRATGPGPAWSDGAAPDAAASADAGGSAEPQVSHYTGPNSSDARCGCSATGPRGSEAATRPGNH